MTNPFTKNQDEAEKLEAFTTTNATTSNVNFPSQPATSPLPSPTSATIPRSPSISKLLRRASMASSDNAIDEEEGEELEALQPPSTSAFLQLQALSRQERELAQASGYKPKLMPSGGNQRHVSISKAVEDPDRAYADPQKETSTTSGAMRNRGIVRTYSMVSMAQIRSLVLELGLGLEQERLS